MPANAEVLQGRSSARRVVLAAPVDELALTFEDVSDMTFDDLDANDQGSSAAAESVVSSSTATRETLA